MDKKNLLENIRRYQFYAVELNLYLDNFPNCSDAIEDYDKVSNRLLSLIAEYESSYGQLVNFGMASNNDAVSWTEDPWPWENEHRGYK